MADPHIEFIDPHEDPDAVDWLDEDDEEHVRSPGSTRLPPRTTARRVLGSLLVFALALAATGRAGTLAYRHDQAVEQAAHTLELRVVDVGDPVTLLDPGALGGDGAWRIDPSAAVAVDVTNESPDPITLLPGATLHGPGLTRPATLRADGGRGLLRPGQSARLTGVASVDCGVQAASVGVDRGNSVLIEARTASGAVGADSVGLDGGGESVRQQICVQQGEGLASSFYPQSFDTAAHSFTVVVSTQSLAAQPLRYQVVETVSTRPTESMPPMNVLLTRPLPVGPVSGTLEPGGTVSAGFTVRVKTCPTLAAGAQGTVELEMLLFYRGAPAVFQMDGFDLGTLVREACSLLS